MGAEDVKSMFKAARAQRGTGASLSKEQIKQLRAQKAAEAQQAADLAQAEKRKTAAAISVKPKAAAGMPPPPPRAPSGPLPTVTTSKSNKATSVNQPQAAVIRHSPRKGQQDSTAAARNAEQSHPPGDNDLQSALSIDSQQAQWRHGAADKQSTASTSDVSSHRQGSAAAAPSRLSPEPAMSQATAQHSSQGHLPSMAGSAVHAAEPRDLEASSNGALPQGFFEAAGSTAEAESRGEVSGRTARTVSMESAASASLPPTAIPKGFFENKEADAKARGQKLPKKKDPKEEFDNFLKSIQGDVQEVENREEAEAAEAAQDNADREAFDHAQRLRRIEALRAMSSTGPSSAASQTGSPDPETIGAGTLSIGSTNSVAAASKKRKRNVSVEVNKSDEDSDDDADAMLDWRAKTF